MNLLEKLMLISLITLILMTGYLTYHGYARTQQWENYDTSQECSYLGRAADYDHTIMIQCADGFIHKEDTRTYGK